MTRYPTATALLLAFFLVRATSAAAAPPKDEPDPDKRVLAVHKDGEKIGELTYKWVQTSSGNEFASSKVELKTRGGSFIVRTHLKRRADGTMEKYKKWIGSGGAKPEVIIFWKGQKIRIVSKIPDNSFTRTHTPPEGFLLLDELGFHLYRGFVRSWRKNGDGPCQVLSVKEGRFATVSVTGAGEAQLTRKDRARMVGVVAVEHEGQQTLIYVDEKDELWGIVAPGLTLTRGGWALGEVQAPVAAPADPGDSELHEIEAEAPPADDTIGAGKPLPQNDPEPKPKPLPID